MEEITPEAFPQPANIDRSVPPVSTPRKFPWITILSLLLAAALTAAGFLFWQNQQLRGQLTTATVPATSATPDIGDPTAGWQTYENTVQKISFKYPSDWKLETKPGSAENGIVYNETLTLTKGTAIIKMFFNMDGIGGAGVTYEGIPYNLDSLSLYKYKAEQSYNNTTIIGLTDTLTQSLGVFKYSNKTYSVTLTYPKADNGTEYESTFDQILSTFKFTNNLLGSSKKYINDKYGYSLQYNPQQASHIICQAEEDNFYLIIPPQQETSEPQNCARDSHFNLELNASDQNLTIVDERYNIKQESTTIGGLQAIKRTYTRKEGAEGPGESWFVTIDFNNNATFFQLYLRNQDLNSLFEQIRTTFSID